MKWVGWFQARLPRETRARPSSSCSWYVQNNAWYDSACGTWYRVSRSQHPAVSRHMSAHHTQHTARTCHGISQHHSCCRRIDWLFCLHTYYRVYYTWYVCLIHNNTSIHAACSEQRTNEQTRNRLLFSLVFVLYGGGNRCCSGSRVVCVFAHHMIW